MTGRFAQPAVEVTTEPVVALRAGCYRCCPVKPVAGNTFVLGAHNADLDSVPFASSLPGESNAEGSESERDAGTHRGKLISAN